MLFIVVKLPGFCKFEKHGDQSHYMRKNTLTIENKEYIVIPKKEFEQLRTKAASKVVPAKKLTLTEGKKLAYKLVDKCAKKSNHS